MSFGIIQGEERHIDRDGDGRNDVVIRVRGLQNSFGEQFMQMDF